MMHHQMWLIRVFECLSVLDAEVALVDIANLYELADNLIKYRIILDNYININAGFGRHSFDRGASDVFNPYYQIPNRFFNLNLYFFKC